MVDSTLEFSQGNQRKRVGTGSFVAARKKEELERIIADEGLDATETRAFVDNAFRDGAIPSAGTAITKIIPPVSRFSKTSGHATKKQMVLDKLTAFFDRFLGLGQSDPSD